MNIKLSTKFMIGMGVIVFCAVGSMSLLFYEYVKTIYVGETFQKTDLVLGHVDATMEYIKDELRPKMFHILKKDEFVLEAMSTSFVNKGVMNRFSAMFPAYIYRRVALNPMDPMNKADAFEARFIHKFAQNPKGKIDWKGLVSRDSREYFIHVKGVVMEKQCAVCHGPPTNSPKSLLARYGPVNGHNWPVGKVVGLVSIAIPMDATLFRIRQIAFSIFLAGLAGMAFLTLFLYYFYYFVTQRPLQKTSTFFKSIVRGEKGLDVRFEVKGQDEIAELADSFNHLIDHLRQSQENRIASESKYRRIFEGSKDAIILTDAHGRIQDINNSGLDLLDIRADDLRKRDLRLQDFFASDASKDEFFHRLEDMSFIKDYETDFLKTSGVEVNVLVTATYNRAENPENGEYECIIKDITERKKMEIQLRQADKLASLGQLAAGVAHEINNPLSIVLGYTKFLKKQVSDSSQQEDIDIIYNNAEMCKKIVEDLLNFARQTKTRHSEANIHETIEAVVTVVENNFAESNVLIARDYDPLLSQSVMDVGKMQQVYMNLIMNAFQAMDQGGRLTITTRYDTEKNGFFVSFSDTGGGISMEIRDRIFDPFFTTKEPGQGTGLGLTVSYGIVEEHGGTISLETEEGKGTTFRIWLPLTKDRSGES